MRTGDREPHTDRYQWRQNVGLDRPRASPYPRGPDRAAAALDAHGRGASCSFPGAGDFRRAGGLFDHGQVSRAVPNAMYYIPPEKRWCVPVCTLRERAALAPPAGRASRAASLLSNLIGLNRIKIGLKSD